MLEKAQRQLQARMARNFGKGRTDDGLTRVDAIEPEKGAGQIRDPELNDLGLELRKRFIRTIKLIERSSARAG